jgi:hypothetical protein
LSSVTLRYLLDIKCFSFVLKLYFGYSIKRIVFKTNDKKSGQDIEILPAILFLVPKAGLEPARA